MDTKDPAAVALGKRRWANDPDAQATRSKGGTARAAKLSKRRRREIAKLAVAAREKKRAERKKSSVPNS